MSGKARVYVQENNEGIPTHLRRFIVVGIVVVPAADATGMPTPPGTQPFIVDGDAAALIAALSNPAQQFSTHSVKCTDGEVYPADPCTYTAGEILRELGDFVLVPLKK